ncbi:MAG: flagellar biosynthetic protein FliO [Chlamydiales bacterium]
MVFLGTGLVTETVSEEVVGQSYDYWGQFINMLTMLGLILILIFVSVYIMKWLMRSRIAHLNRSTGIKILERRALNSKSSLYLIDVFGTGVLIAESQAGIQLVTQLPPDIKIEEKMTEYSQEKSLTKEPLIKRLKKLASKNN